MLKLIVCVTGLFITIDVVQCKPYVYTFNPELPGWVALHMIPATWEEAVLTCHFEGATLASPIDEKLSKVLHEAVTEADQKIYVGTRSLFFGDVFVSVEGVPLANMPVKFRNSDNAHETLVIVTDTATHTDNQEVCLTMGTYIGHNLYTSSCTERHPYVCYKKLNYETPNQCGTFDDKYHLNTATGSCYKLHRHYHKWSRANMICAAEGGYLVILNNAQEAKFVTEMFLDDDFGPMQVMHIGLRAWTSERVWLTGHGESLDDVFNSGLWEGPNNFMGTEYSCAVLTRSGDLKVIQCYSKSLFVCEKDPMRLMYQTVINGSIN